MCECCPQRENGVGWGGWRPSGWESGLILGKAERELGKGSQEVSLQWEVIKPR